MWDRFSQGSESTNVVVSVKCLFKCQFKLRATSHWVKASNVWWKEMLHPIQEKPNICSHELEKKKKKKKKKTQPDRPHEATIDSTLKDIMVRNYK